MSITEIILKMPCWYFVIMILFSLYYAIRGLVEQMIMYGDSIRMSRAQKIIYAYIQEILFKVIITASGFIALLVANYMFSLVKAIDEIGVGTAIVLVFLIVWGATGVSGYLTYLIVSGKFPIVVK